jgi:hypothetical protein
LYIYTIALSFVTNFLINEDSIPFSLKS